MKIMCAKIVEHLLVMIQVIIPWSYLINLILDQHLNTMWIWACYKLPHPHYMYGRYHFGLETTMLFWCREALLFYGWKIRRKTEGSCVIHIRSLLGVGIRTQLLPTTAATKLAYTPPIYRKGNLKVTPQQLLPWLAFKVHATLLLLCSHRVLPITVHSSATRAQTMEA